MIFSSKTIWDCSKNSHRNGKWNKLYSVSSTPPRVKESSCKKAGKKDNDNVMFLRKINWSKSQIVNQMEKTQKNIYKYKNITIKLKTVYNYSSERRSLAIWIYRWTFVVFRDVIKDLDATTRVEEMTEEKNKNRWDGMTTKLSKIVILSFP